MKSYIISKNLEQDPLVYGLLPNLFYLVLAVVFGGGMVGVFVLLAALSGGSISSFFLYLIIWGSAIVIVYKNLRKKSQKEKYQFKQKRNILSNRDLFSEL